MNYKKNKITICLPIEIISRDLDTKIYLSLNILKKFKECIVGSQHQILKYISENKDRNFVYIEKGQNAHTNDPIYNFLKSKGVMIIVLHEEGGVFTKHDWENFNSFSSDNTLSYVDALFSWGNKIHNKLLKIEKILTW